MGKSERKFIMVGLGEILWDMLPEGKQLGGAPANFAYHAQALGGQGVVVSCIGDDDLGKEILGCLDEMKLDSKYVAVDGGHPTGTVTIRLDENGKPDYIIHENVAWDFIPSSSALLSLAGETDAVCFGSLCQRSEVSQKTVRSFLTATRPDCIRLFDINIRQSYYNEDVVRTMLKLSNVLKLNDEELVIVAGLLGIKGSDTNVLSELTKRYELSLIALTKGPEGSRLYTGSRDCECEAAPIDKIADTVGAGDAFSAAIAIGWLRGDDLDRINAKASRVASFVCSQSGATPPLAEDLTEGR
ncbi:MAG: carbohydrate kinase [Planctomycetota bacterium]|nr:MAG: carbohydrate kinase [Planctomycetota bacterium]